MSVTLAQGCQGADSMWSGEAKLGRCDSDNRLPYFWLCIEVQVLLLLLSTGRCAGPPQPATASSQCPGPRRSSMCVKQGIGCGTRTSKGSGLEMPQGTNIFSSPIAEAEGFPDSPAVRSTQPRARELLCSLWLLSHCFCFSVRFSATLPTDCP